MSWLNWIRNNALVKLVINHVLVKLKKVLMLGFDLARYFLCCETFTWNQLSESFIRHCLTTSQSLVRRVIARGPDGIPSCVL
jgi:hypothetical protein